MRDKIINLHSSVANSKDILKKAIINNESNPDQNILQGEIAIVNTNGNEGIYTLNSDGTDIIEFKPLSKEEKDKLTELISAGVKDEVYVGNDEPSGEQEIWVDLDADPTVTIPLVTEAPKDGKQYARQDGAWSEVSGGSTQYLDLSMFTGDSGTLSDEDYQKVVKAYEDNINIALFESSKNPISISYNTSSYIILMNLIQYNVDYVYIGTYTFIINTSDKQYNISQSLIGISYKGSGTKALTDNGEYAEFAKPTKVYDMGNSLGDYDLDPNTYYILQPSSALTVSLKSGEPMKYNEYMFEFTCGDTPITLTDIPNVKWQNGDKLVPEANCTYQVSIVNNCAVYAKFPNV